MHMHIRSRACAAHMDAILICRKFQVADCLIGTETKRECVVKEHEQEPQDVPP